MLDLRIALAQSDMAGLEKELYAVSEPDSERYGLHLSKSEVRIALPLVIFSQRCNRHRVS